MCNLTIVAIFTSFYNPQHEAQQLESLPIQTAANTDDVSLRQWQMLRSAEAAQGCAVTVGILKSATISVHCKSL